MQGNFSSAAMNSLQQGEAKGGGYASRDANNNPFPLYRQGAYMFTDFTPAGLSNSAYALERNAPTDSVMAMNAMQNDGVSQATQQNIAMVNRTQSLETNSVPIGCTSANDPCSAWPGAKCVAVNIDWDDSKGNQTNFCSTTNYPELKNGIYHRLNSSQGGIGKACNHNGDCGQGYACNNETNIFGKNRQQTGFCSQTYSCPNGSTYFAGYPYDASTPIAPPPDQNNYGKGYASKQECSNNLQGYQDCVQDTAGRWFATYSQFCPVMSNLRQGGNPVGQFTTSPPAQKQIIMPGWGTQGPSRISSAPQAFSAWNINSEASQTNEDKSPLAYSMNINPRPN